MLLHTHARFVVDFDTKTVFATAKLWVKPKPGSNSVALNLRSNVELLSVSVNGALTPFSHDDLLRQPGVLVQDSLLSLDSYNAVYRVAATKSGTGELEIDVSGCPPSAATVPTGESSSVTLPSGASVVGTLIVDLLYRFSPHGLDAVGFHEAPIALRGLNRTTANTYFIACGGSSVVGGVDANGGCGVSTWLPCIDSRLPHARSTYDIDIALLHGRLNTCVNGNASTPGGDEAPEEAHPLTVVASGDYIGEFPATMALPRPTGGVAAYPLYFRRFRVAEPVHAHALAFAVGPFSRIAVTPPLSGGAIGLTCSVYAPSWLTSVLSPVVRDLNAIVHALHISLGTAPRFNVHHTVFAPLPQGLRSVSSHGLSFIPLTRVLSCVVTPEEVPMLQRTVCEALVLSWIQSYLTVTHWADAWILVGLAGSMALTSIGALFGPGELEYHVYSQQQELLQLEDAYPHLLCLRPLNPASADTLSSQHPHYQSFLRLKAPLVWYMLTGWVGKDIMKAAVLAMLAAAAGVSEGLTSVAHPPPLSREDSDGLGSPSGSSSVISSYTAALSSVFTDGVSTDSLLTIVSGETVTETGEIAQAFLADWVHGTGYPRFRAHVSFNRKHNRADFRVEQSIREAGKLFHGGLTFRLVESSDRVVDKRNNKVDKAKSTFSFPLTEKARARGPMRQQMGRARDREAPKFSLTTEALKEDQAFVVNKAHVDDDGVLENDLSLKYFRIDPEYLWIKRIEVRGSLAQIETMATSQLRCDTNTMSQLEAVSLLYQVEIDIDDARRALSVIRTLKRCVHDPDLHYRVRAAACNTLSRWQSRHSPRVNFPVAPEQSWHGLSTLILAYKERYCDESGMPTPFTIMSTADQVLRRALVTAMSHCRHSCGTVPLPAIGFLLKLLSYHDSGSAFDDSAFLSDLMEAVQSAAMHATPSSGNYECNLTFLEEERRSFVASDKALYVLVPSSEASGVSHSGPAWLGVSGVGNPILGPYDDPRTTAQPLKAINPYDKSQVQNAALLEERRRAQIVDPRDCAVLMGVSQRTAGPITGMTLVNMAVQSIQRVLMLKALAFQPDATAVEIGFGVTSNAHVIVTALRCLSVLYAKFPSTNDASIDFLSFCGVHFPLDVRVASVAAFCKVFVERTPWDSVHQRFGSDDDGDVWLSDPTSTASSVSDVAQKGEQWVCSFLRLLGVICEDGDPVFQRDATRAVLAMQWANCSAKQRALRDKLGLLSEISLEELQPKSVFSDQPSTRSTLRVLLPSARIDALRKHVASHTHPSTGDSVHSPKYAYPALALWQLMNEGSTFQWDLRRALFHLYHSIWGPSSPAKLPAELPGKIFTPSELPFLTQLYALITTVRTTHENKMLSDAYELVALVRKEVSEDEVDEKEKRRALVEERASRMLDKDFFKEYNPRVLLRRLPNGFIPKALFIKQLNAEKLRSAHTIKIKHTASGVETDASTKKVGVKGSKPVPELGLGGGVAPSILPPARPPLVAGTAGSESKPVMSVSLPGSSQPSAPIQPITSPSLSLKLTVAPPQQPSAGVLRFSLPKKQ